MGRWE